MPCREHVNGVRHKRRRANAASENGRPRAAVFPGEERLSLVKNDITYSPAVRAREATMR